MNFDGQGVIVTGASRGIGKEIALQFAARGAHVACVATTEKNAAHTAEEINDNGGTARAFACDVSDASQVEEFFQRAAESLANVSVLVNNAGATKDSLLLRMREEDWDRVLDINLKGAFLTIRAASKIMMKARYGRIVNLTSVIGLGGGAGQANYAAAKAGIVGLTKSVAREFGSRNITCNAVAPGFVETDMTAELPQDFRDFVQSRAPAGRLGVAADIAPAVLFLASREAAYVTGQVLVVDGGLTL